MECLYPSSIIVIEFFSGIVWAGICDLLESIEYFFQAFLSFKVSIEMLGAAITCLLLHITWSFFFSAFILVIFIFVLYI